MPTSVQKHRILVISSAEESETKLINDAFIKSINQRLGRLGSVEWCNYHDIGIELSVGNIRAFLLDSNTDLQSFDAIYFKSYFRFEQQACAIAEYLSEHAIPFVGSELKSYIATSKLTQLARLARAALPIPKTLYMSTAQYPKQYERLTTQLGDRFIFKAIDGSTGDDNHLIKSATQLAKIVQLNPKKHFVAQAFIPNNSDMRVLIVGGDIRLVIDRRRHDDTTHLNNTSQGAQASLLEPNSLSKSVRSLALQSVAVMDREIAGVDIMLEKHNGQPYILEVNASPQIASGAFEAEKLAIYEQYFKQLMGQKA